MMNKNLVVLAVETSCDDTSVAIVQNNVLLSNIIISSSEFQNVYGGIVPELAARHHEKNIIVAFQQATKNIDIKNVDLVAYAYEPGLRVCLNVGEAFSTTISTILNKPLIKVNHIFAHLFAFLNDHPKTYEFPFLGLIISGGHTSIYLVKSFVNLELLNGTVDDAVGECYDKIARALGLPYPGGPNIDKLFDIKKASLQFLKQMPQHDSPFSFSGLKTAVVNYINTQKMKSNVIDVETIASSFQNEIIKIVMQKMRFLIDKYNVNDIVVGGGVACNTFLRSQLKTLKNIRVHIPTDPKMCIDNAGMIALYASFLYQSNH